MSAAGSSPDPPRPAQLGHPRRLRVEGTLQHEKRPLGTELLVVAGDVRTGDLVTGIGPLLDEIQGHGLLCVVTSWRLGYLETQQRTSFIDAARARAPARQ